MCAPWNATEILIPEVLRPESKRREPSRRAEGVATHASGAGNFQAELGTSRAWCARFFFVETFGKEEIPSFLNGSEKKKFGKEGADAEIIFCRHVPSDGDRGHLVPAVQSF